MPFRSLIRKIAPKIRMLCFVLIRSVYIFIILFRFFFKITQSKLRGIRRYYHLSSEDQNKKKNFSLDWQETDNVDTGGGGKPGGEAERDVRKVRRLR